MSSINRTQLRDEEEWQAFIAERKKEWQAMFVNGDFKEMFQTVEWLYAERDNLQAQLRVVNIGRGK